MLRNLILVTLRNIKRQKAFSFLNVIGLSIGLSTCLLVAIYNYDEFSYDQFHEKADRIYRVNQTFIWGETDNLFGSTGPAVMQAIAAEVPEFEALTRVHPPGSFLIKSTNKDTPVIFEEENVLAADSNFLEIFTFLLISGNPSTALTHPNSLILTETMARKYFDDTEVLGKQLRLGEPARQKTYQITGVAYDVPENSHIQFDFLLSMSSFPKVKDNSDSWMWTNFVTFGLLREDASPAVVAEKVAEVPGKYLEPFLQKYRGISYEEFLASGERWNLYIQPFTDIHLKSKNVYSRLNEVGDIQTVYILSLVAVLILLISLINFVNLSTARSSTRTKEVGIRKVIGSEKKLLIYQFIAESVIYCLTAMIIALILVELLTPFLTSFMGKRIDWHLTDAPILLIGFVVTTIVIGILGGLYPAFYLSSFKPAAILKGGVHSGAKGGAIRNILVTSQFSLSIALIACTLVVNDQVRFWQNVDVGFDRKNKIILENVERLGSSTETFKNEILNDPLIEEVTFSSDTPPSLGDFDNFSMKGTEDKSISVNYVMTDEHFIKVYGVDLLYGRNFSNQFNDSLNVIVSKSLTKSFGYSRPEDALNEYLRYGELDWKIVGIIDDMNINLSDQLYPTALFYKNNPIYNDPSKEFTISLTRDASGDEMLQLLEKLEAKWYSVAMDVPFNYTFLDQEYLKAFRSTIRFSTILSSLAGMAVFIACLGLIGLVAFVIEKRNKEIGIRKVLGASTFNILLLLSGNFGKLLLIGFIVAVPISWHIMEKWLEDFELRTSISAVTFLFAGGIMLLIAAVTMSFQTLKASRVNPVDYLKEE